MTRSEDFSRRLFADFIASRIKAWGREYDGSGPTMRVSARGGTGAHPRVSSEPTGADARGTAGGSDARAGEPRVPADQRRTPELGLG
jgi:hypothetical protein